MYRLLCIYVVISLHMHHYFGGLDALTTPWSGSDDIQSVVYVYFLLFGFIFWQRRPDLVGTRCICHTVHCGHMFISLFHLCLRDVGLVVCMFDEGVRLVCRC